MSGPTRGNLAKRLHAEFLRRLAADAADTAIRLRRLYLKAMGGFGQQISQAALNPAGIQALRNDLQEALATLEPAILEAALRAQRDGAAAGAAYGDFAIKAAGVQGALGTVAVETLEAGIGYVEHPAFQQTVRALAPYHANQLYALLLNGMTRGVNPAALVRQARDYVSGRPYYDLARLMRTTQLWSARRGTLAGFQASSGAVQGWEWACALDLRTCVGCWSMHGTRHGLNEMLNDHHNGRCAMVPFTAYSAPMASGEAEFSQLSAEDQRRVMGNGAWQAWRDGAFGFSQMNETYQYAPFGEMRRERSLAGLIGPDAAMAYAQAGR